MAYKDFVVSRMRDPKLWTHKKPGWFTVPEWLHSYCIRPDGGANTWDDFIIIASEILKDNK